MLESLARNWWLAVLDGIVAVIFGVAAFVWPGITLGILVLLIGAFAFIDGFLTLSFGLWAAGADQSWWSLVLGGILGIIVGVLAFARTSEMAQALVYVFGIWAIATGLLEIVAALRLREVITTEWLLGLGGVLSIIFGVAVMVQPAAGALAIVYIFGIYAVLSGLSQIGLGYRLHGLTGGQQPRPQRAPLG